uniref:NAD-dependent epimerase/dehydratase family protein n=1 Tax=Enterobacter hormaechei TaxID=158836 RepID=UPI0013D4B2E5
GRDEPLTGLDIRPPAQPTPGVGHEPGNICDGSFIDLVMRHKPRVVVHLASVVAAGGDPERDYAIDVVGTGNVLRACLAAGVSRLVVTSS